MAHKPAVTESFESEVKYFQHPVVLMDAPDLSLSLSLSLSPHYDAVVNGD